MGNIEHDGYYSRTFTTQEHYGTHLDAPAHFARGMWTVDQIPAERLVRPLVVLNVRSKVSGHPDYEVSVQDIADWETQNGEIPSGAVVMAYTGWEDRWNTPKAFRNAGTDGVPHFPGFSLEAATFLVKTRDAAGLGIDTMSMDPGASKTYPVHQFTAKASVYQLENVANLGLVPACGSDDCGCSDQAGERFGRPGAAAGVGEVGTRLSHSHLTRAESLATAKPSGRTSECVYSRLSRPAPR